MFKLIIVCSALVAVTWCASTRTCAKGRGEGETVENGRYWYVCQDGNLVMKGCVSDAGKRLAARETYVSNGYVIECTEVATGEYAFKYKGCSSEGGQEHAINDVWQDKNYWYQCSSVGEKVSAEIRGCVDDGKRYNLDDSMFKTDLVYVCKRKSDGTIGWDSFPNRAVTVTYSPDKDRVHERQP